MKNPIERILLSIAIAPLAVAFFLVACAMAGPREARKILRRG
ncbi:hypothetical protein [Sphingomonas sp.]|nr:hypothetical protein [Sphingomonas sp.]